MCRRCRCSAATLSGEAPSSASRPAGTFIKVCGVVCPEDAELAAAAGADFIGMIMWPKAKRAVSTSVARSIAEVARRHNAKVGSPMPIMHWTFSECFAPAVHYCNASTHSSNVLVGHLQAVGVFVDEGADVIARKCEEAELDLAQLHGAGAREALPSLPRSLGVIYVLHADSSGQLQTAAPAADPASAGSGLDSQQCRCFALLAPRLACLATLLQNIHLTTCCGQGV